MRKASPPTREAGERRIPTPRETPARSGGGADLAARIGGGHHDRVAHMVLRAGLHGALPPHRIGLVVIMERAVHPRCGRVHVVEDGIAILAAGHPELLRHASLP